MALGRGLGSLIPQKQTMTEQVLPQSRREILEVDPMLIDPNPRQPRHDFAPEDLENLVASIKEHGVLQPIIVTKKMDGRYELIAGERRLRSSKLAQQKTIPVIVREAGEQDKLELALIENIQRQDLNAIEEAIAYRALIDEFNLTQDQVASRVGKSRPVIANTMRLLDLPPEMVEAVRDGRISKSQGRTLLSELDADKRNHLFACLLDGGMTVQSMAAKVASSPGNRKNPRLIQEKGANILAHEQQLREKYGTKVTIADKGGKGKVEIEYYSPEELVELLRTLHGV
ncbi:ParB/RepB/Spo0J family partition protein [Candidatus Uhrbacteria bacterium]|nr:ParB/RepB/Spo0J family partition protein [Candidatus Uhrbacteria bacterium]